ncbi:DUF1302 family protein [Kordia zhangzhouensis]|uniref:DUF1302 family protein n=1 Tax=Kordia zhangzhouensis TaxID=1620405 RepID=UPI0006292DC4|nr:DUF1302 family protein [Kordia zhangzhouensis]
MIKSFFSLTVCFLLFAHISFSQTQQPEKEKDTLSQKKSQGGIKLDMLDGDMFDTGTERDTITETIEGDTETKKSFWNEYIFSPSRLGISYEFTYNFTDPTEVIKNRFAFRLEYSKFLFNNLFVQLDTKSFVFMDGDSRSRRLSYYNNDDFEEADLAFGSITRNAFVQYSYKQSSIKVGLQTLAWGESDFAAITDEINPFDFRDPLNLNIDELRVGQFMIGLNFYTSIGNFNTFFVPNARFNLFPKEGTRFFEDSFAGTNIVTQEVDNGKNSIEYGFRWKKAFKKSDVSIIVTSLIDNNLVREQVNPNLVQLHEKRFTTVGMSFNYAIGNLLIRGENAIKFPRAYNTASLGIIERNAFDTSLGFEYGPNSTTTFTLELVNNHVINWTNEIVGIPRNDFTAFFVVVKELMKNDLSLNYITMYNGPNTTFFNLLSAAYKLNDNITLSLDAIIPITNDEQSAFYQFREQQHLAFKAQFLF